MNARQLVEKTLNFDAPTRIPRQLWLLPWAEAQYPDQAFKLRQEYPDDLIAAPEIYQAPLGRVGNKYQLGLYIDEWGCKFNNIHSGVIGVVEEPRIATWEDLAHFKTPDAALAVDKDEINRFCRTTDRFVTAPTFQRPFERYQFLRTAEQTFYDFADFSPEVIELLNRIHQHYCQEIDVWASTEIDAITVMDDWGMQSGLLISPVIFRKFFKPMYQDYVEIARQHGKYIFLHSDGNISEIMPDLIEIGFDALNSQLFCLDIPALGQKFRGQMTFWGEIDRQNLLPNGSADDIRQAVYFVYDHLWAEGGIIAQCEFGPGAKPENLFTVFETWNEINEKYF